MTKTGKGYDKIISVFFRKVYVWLKRIFVSQSFLVVSSVFRIFESHAILKKK